MREQLLREGHRFGFFQAVRLLERIHPDRDPVGLEDSSPSREVVRFKGRNSLEFPASQIYQIAEPAGAKTSAAANAATAFDAPIVKAVGTGPLEMTVNFMGLTGPEGVLPNVYTELVMERNRFKDTAPAAFLDIFNHRLVSLFYRAFEKYRFHIGYERNGADRLTEIMFDVIGMGTPGLKGRMSVEDQGLLLYAGLIAQRPHSASAVEGLLKDYFGVPVKLLSFFGQWLDLDADSVSRMGQANSSMGVNLVSGTKIYNNQSKFRLVVGPLRYKEFASFLPTGKAYRSISELTRFMVGLELDFDLQLILRKDDVPMCQLSAQAAVPAMLGWTSWALTGKAKEDASQVVLPPWEKKPEPIKPKVESEEREDDL